MYYYLYQVLVWGALLTNNSYLTVCFQEAFRQFKSAPVDSLTHRLAVVMAVVNHSYGGVRAVAHLWQEFVLEMRYRWENNYIITELVMVFNNAQC